jgi:hypothetical protein
MIPLWKGKNPIFGGVIRAKVKVTITITRMFDNRIVSAYALFKMDFSFNITKSTRNVCITKYARLYKLSNGIMVMTPK